MTFTDATLPAPGLSQPGVDTKLPAVENSETPDCARATHSLVD